MKDLDLIVRDSNNCINCPDSGNLLCQPCPLGQSCLLQVQSCESCAQAICVDDPDISIDGHSSSTPSRNSVSSSTSFSMSLESVRSGFPSSGGTFNSGNSDNAASVKGRDGVIGGIIGGTFLMFVIGGILWVFLVRRRKSAPPFDMETGLDKNYKSDEKPISKYDKYQIRTNDERKKPRRESIEHKGKQPTIDSIEHEGNQSTMNSIEHKGKQLTMNSIEHKGKQLTMDSIEHEGNQSTMTSVEPDMKHSSDNLSLYKPVSHKVEYLDIKNVMSSSVSHNVPSISNGLKQVSLKKKISQRTSALFSHRNSRYSEQLTGIRYTETPDLATNTTMPIISEKIEAGSNDSSIYNGNTKHTQKPRNLSMLHQKWTNITGSPKKPTKDIISQFRRSIANDPPQLPSLTDLGPDSSWSLSSKEQGQTQQESRLSKIGTPLPISNYFEETQAGLPTFSNVPANEIYYENVSSKYGSSRNTTQTSYEAQERYTHSRSSYIPIGIGIDSVSYHEQFREHENDYMNIGQSDSIPKFNTVTSHSSLMKSKTNSSSTGSNIPLSGTDSNQWPADSPAIQMKPNMSPSLSSRRKSTSYNTGITQHNLDRNNSHETERYFPPTVMHGNWSPSELDSIDRETNNGFTSEQKNYIAQFTKPEGLLGFGHMPSFSPIQKKDIDSDRSVVSYLPFAGSRLSVYDKRGSEMSFQIPNEPSPLRKTRDNVSFVSSVSTLHSLIPPKVPPKEYDFRKAHQLPNFGVVEPLAITKNRFSGRGTDWTQNSSKEGDVSTDTNMIKEEVFVVYENQDISVVTPKL